MDAYLRIVLGSSPHPWGTLLDPYITQPSARFIPTPVGNTSISTDVLDRHHGSSPHPWGTHDKPATVLGHERFIPTPVGNTQNPCTDPRYRPVHPHTRGEHMLSSRTTATRVGSSPHPWGTLFQSQPRYATLRFIPTPVGNTRMEQPYPALCSVHPHTRGEHTGAPCRLPTLIGSSPHPWGTRVLVHSAPVNSRFIPTPVGNTRTAISAI